MYMTLSRLFLLAGAFTLAGHLQAQSFGVRSDINLIGTGSYPVLQNMPCPDSETGTSGPSPYVPQTSYGFVALLLDYAPYCDVYSVAHFYEGEWSLYTTINAPDGNTTFSNVGLNWIDTITFVAEGTTNTSVEVILVSYGGVAATESNTLFPPTLTAALGDASTSIIFAPGVDGEQIAKANLVVETNTPVPLTYSLLGGCFNPSCYINIHTNIYLKPISEDVSVSSASGLLYALP
jgi:hypothetical protein